MIDRTRLLADCQAEAKRLVESLRERLTAEPALREKLEAEHQAASKVGRTGDTFTEWLEERLEQVAASWVLACVFVRFLEDNDLVETPKLSGPSDRLTRARDEETVYFRKHASHSVREYLEDVFRATATLPGMTHLLGEGRNALWTLGPTGDGARALLELWRQRDAGTGVLGHDFTDPTRDTRFLGDLYQDLSEFARKRYALLQTPEFVEEFILDRTLEPALAEFGLEHTTLIDPACGSGHFLLGAFARLLRRWQKKDANTPPAALAQKALNAVAGVDLNPFAVAIARFRLLVAALAACGIARLKDAPAFEVALSAGDSLLHGPRPDDGRSGNLPLPGLDPNEHYYAVEDAAAVKRILSTRYAVVVANPPYITPKDSGQNALIRKRFGSCHRQYSLAVPFKERCFDLVRWQEEASTEPAGFVGLITANSFMKREFGAKLIEEYFPRWDLTHVVDTSGAYIPGHGTPTVILFARGRNPRPFEASVRAVRGIRGEPSTPSDPAQGRVWIAILQQIDRAGSQSEFVSVDDAQRATFHKHPWSVGGGGAAELKERIEGASEQTLKSSIQEIGRTTHTGEDNVFYRSPSSARTKRLSDHCVPLVVGEGVRDYQIDSDAVTVFPYDKENATPLAALPAAIERHFWTFRTTLKARIDFGQTPEERGLRWFDHSMFFPARFRTPLSIAFAEVASHNHFVLDRGGRVFKQTAPVIKLPPEASEDDHLALLALLNSSIACFWLQQVCFPKGGESTGKKRQSETWARRFVFDGTKLSDLPLKPTATERLLPYARLIDTLARERFLLRPAAVIERWRDEGSVEHLAGKLRGATARDQQLLGLMAAAQEEIDWLCYFAYGLVDVDDSSPPEELEPIDPSVRPFEVLLARELQRGRGSVYWFEFVQRQAVTEVPAHYRPVTRTRFNRRLERIASDSALHILESPDFKRRWEPRDTDEETSRALRAWLLDRLESPRYWPDPPTVRSAAQLADLARHDPELLQVAEVYRDRPDFDVTALVTELVEAESVPAQAACRYKPSGLRKHAEWRKTWDLQRREDAIDARTTLPEDDPNRLTLAQAEDEKRRIVGKIPVPPKYDSGDFQSHVSWQHRGKLDVPKERFVSLPGAERDGDPTPVVLWAGYDHLQQAQAIAGYYVERKEQDAWPKDRLLPLLVALHELVPWLKQWHNAFDPAYGLGLGDYFAGFVDDEARAHGLTLADLDAWLPAKRARKTTKKAAGAKKPAAKAAPDGDEASTADSPGNGTSVKKKKPGRKKKVADPEVAN